MLERPHRCVVRGLHAASLSPLGVLVAAPGASKARKGDEDPLARTRALCTEVNHGRLIGPRWTRTLNYDQYVEDLRGLGEQLGNLAADIHDLDDRYPREHGLR